VIVFLINLFRCHWLAVIQLSNTTGDAEGKSILLPPIPTVLSSIRETTTAFDIVNSSVLLSKPKSAFHSWGPEGIEFDLVLRYINASYYTYTFSQQNEKPFPAFIVMHKNKPTMFVSVAVQNKIKGKLGGWRMQMLLINFQKALQVQLVQHHDRFPALVKVLREVGSLPLLFDLSDYRGCLIGSRSPTVVATDIVGAPLFTLCRSPNCNYAFPIPTYSTYEYADTFVGGLEQNITSWNERMEYWKRDYPWTNKTAKVYWRGSCRLGAGLNRKRFVKKAAARTAQTYMQVSPVGTCHKINGDPNPSPPEDSMKYKAVFDIDGNSWSERFPRLMCYNSAIVRIGIGNDEMEEYFMTDVIPGVHYIPATLENFTTVANMIMQPENDAMLRRVMQNANQWCRERLTVERLNLDFLSVLNGYVDALNIRDANWSQHWLQVASAYVGEGVFESGHEGFVLRIPTNWKRRAKAKKRRLDNSEKWHLPI
jgi:hypothetical protein